MATEEQRAARSTAGPWRTEQQFGRSVGLVLLLIGAWLTWRGAGPLVPRTLFAVGGLLVFFGIVYPRALVWPNRAWMRLAEALSYVATRVILAVVFFLVVTPIGIVMRLTKWDPLGRRRASAESYWEPYPERQQTPQHLEKMF